MTIPMSSQDRNDNYQQVTDAFYRYSDIIFEWHKLLDPCQSNAIKSLMAVSAMAHPDHPLRKPGEEGIELYLALFPDKKVRLLFAQVQIEYLRYYIKSMGLIKPNVETKQDSPEALTAVEKQETVMEDGSEELANSTYIPLPSSKQFVFKSQATDLLLYEQIPIILKDADQLRLVNRNPLKAYKQMKAGTFYHSMTEAAEKKAEKAECAAVDSAIGEEMVTMRAKEIKQPIVPEDVEGVEIGPSVSRKPCAETTFFHAEQAYIIASQGGEFPTYSRPPTGKYRVKAGQGIFVSLDFSSWEMELGVIVEVGWAATWFEMLNKDGKTTCEEQKDQGHWVVREHLEYQNGDVIPEKRADYLFGDTQIIPLMELQKNMHNFIDGMRAKVGGVGPVYLVVHTADKPLETLGLLDLPYETFHKDLQPGEFIAPGYASCEGNDQVFVFDTSEMAAALQNGQVEVEDRRTSDISLEELCSFVFRDAPEPLEGFGNSGNDAWLNLECFLALVTKKLDIAKTEYILAKVQDQNAGQPDDKEIAEEDAAEAKEWAQGLNESDDLPEYEEFSFKPLMVDIGPKGPEADESDED